MLVQRLHIAWEATAEAANVTRGQMKKYGEAVLEVTDVLQAFRIAAASGSGAGSTLQPSTIPEPSASPHAGNPSVPSNYWETLNTPTE